MSGKVLSLDDVLQPDDLAVGIANSYINWNSLRENKVRSWTELRKYVFAEDTSHTSNASLPWKNKTHTPKLCQIRDNLHANYMRSLFPKRKWVTWEAYDEEAYKSEKKQSIESFTEWLIERSGFKETISKLVLDFIDYGNVFADVEWVDETQTMQTFQKVGYVGPVARRISPLDIVFNPTSPSFEQAPKITRVLTSLGEVKEYLERESTDDNREEMTELFNYLKDLREHVSDYDSVETSKDELYQVDGFSNFRDYLLGDFVELLVFRGDYYDMEGNEFKRNHIVTVVDRHKVLGPPKPDPSYFGRPPVFHAGWRIRQDNLWAMGPLDNLVGMQYRIDHLENLKADVFDLFAFPPLKIKGYVEDFEWGPFTRIYVGDDGEVEVLAPDVQALSADTQIAILEQRMEEMAGAPKEALGFRTPGEKTRYEVQRLENAASRVFQAKIEQFEMQIIEPLLNAMLELARRRMTTTDISVYNPEFNVEIFQPLTAAEITGNGRVVPIAARHFAEKAERVQNINAFFSSPMGQNPNVLQHWSGIKISEMMEDLLDIEPYNLVTPFVAISEQAEAQKLINSQQENVLMEASTPSGIAEDDASIAPI